jgi:uncharacterized protein YraI
MKPGMKPAVKHAWTFSLLALILALLACNWSDIAPLAAPEIEPSPLPTFAIPTLTPVPTQTPLPTPTSTPDVPVALPKTLGVNCRSGPGQEWGVVSAIPVGTKIEIKGRTIDTSWWYVRDPMEINERYCWVAYEAVDAAGNLNIVPIVDTPVATAVEVKVDMVVVTFSACGGSNPVTLNGTISTTGPTTVTYHWEVNGATQETTDDATLKFTQSNSLDVTTEMALSDCGDYTATLRVNVPNEVFAQKTFKIQGP